MCSSCPFRVSTRCPSTTPVISTRSTFHWKTLVNGYSGYYPPSYIRRLVHLSTFPSPEALEQIRDDNVRYVVVHEERYLDPAEAARTCRGHSSGSGASRSDGWTTGGIWRR